MIAYIASLFNGLVERAVWSTFAISAEFIKLVLGSDLLRPFFSR